MPMLANLVAFNVGVELGQILALAAILIAMGWWRRTESFHCHAYTANVVILVTIVLPSEYGIDPTGAGKIMGLTEMGEIRQELKKEAEADHRSSFSEREEPGVVARLLGALVGTAHAQGTEAWKDEVRFELSPKQTHELKLTMKKDDVA